MNLQDSEPIEYNKSLLAAVSKQCKGFDPGLMFCLGFTYCRLGDKYDPKGFIALAKIAHKKISRHRFPRDKIEKTYRDMYEQDYLGEVLNLQWFKDEHDAFEEEFQEIEAPAPKEEVIPRFKQESQQKLLHEDHKTDKHVDIKHEDPPTKDSPVKDPPVKDPPVKDPPIKDPKTHLQNPQPLTSTSSEAKNPRKRNYTERSSSDSDTSEAARPSNPPPNPSNAPQPAPPVSSCTGPPQSAPCQIPAAAAHPSSKSQIAETPQSPPQPCIHCGQPFKGAPLSLGCGHNFHYDCMKEGILAQFEANIVPLKCPTQGCKSEFSEEQIMTLTSKEHFEHYKRIQAQMKG
ncbi:unnamed protein product [Moneuplotes crassus]|uniref:RING-type domain-containing protein n=1 Tax=Euplotes crassus TaxID=5936 RepID=A0AAD1UHP9_EUPCR|nr:unnamed protein product [Moneuplotes crassus]